MSARSKWVALVAPIALGATRVALGVLWLREGIFKYSAHFGRADILIVAHSTKSNSRVPEYFTAVSDITLRAWPDIFGIAIPLLETLLGIALILGVFTRTAAIVSALTLVTYWSSDQLITQYPLMAALSTIVIAFPAWSDQLSARSFGRWVRGRAERAHAPASSP